MVRELSGIHEKVSFEENQSILLYLNREPESYDTHWHAAGEIVMPIENSYSVSVSGQTYELQERDIFFIPPGELHQLISRPTGVRLIFMFDIALISTMQDFSAITPVLSQPILISPTRYGEIHESSVGLLNRIIEEYSNPAAPLRQSMIYSYLIQFFVQIGRLHIRTDLLFPDVRTNKQMEYFDKMNTVVNYINNNYTEDITLEKMASLAGFSKFHFSRLFKQFTEHSFYAYLNQRRVKAAETLLLNPNISVTDVALQSGFSSISTFNRVFRAAKECTPSEYKAYYQHQGKKIRMY